MNDILSVELTDALTGRITVKNCSGSGSLSGIAGAWQIISGGERCSGGRFLTGAFLPQESREILLSLEIPEVSPGAEPFLEVEFSRRESGEVIHTATFALPAVMYKIQDDGCFTTGIRADASQAMISGGKISAVISAGGMRELRYKGEHLLSETPRLTLWQHGCEKDSRIAALNLDRIRISPDRFTAGNSAVECHALALPRQMELDELEFTQRFVPLTSGAIRYETEFIVPESFAGVPRLGVEFAGVPALSEISVFPDEKAAEFIALKDSDGTGLLVASAGYPVRISTLPYSEYALIDTVHPLPDGKIHVTVDCRNSQEAYIGAGRFRMVLFFAPLAPGEDPAEKARRLRLGK